VFKNVRLFKLDDPAAVELDQLERQLAGLRFRPCGPLETATMGWVPPLGEDGGALSHEGGECVLVCARRQERMLPAAVVAETLDEKIAEIEDREARTVGRKERRQLKDEVLLDLLPRAFTRSRRACAYLDRQTGWLLVDAASASAAEDLVDLLRETLGSLPVHPPRPPQPPAVLLTRWVTTGELPPGLTLGDECELRDARDDKVVARCRGHDLAGEEVATHLRAGKQVTKLALDWRESLAFVLQEDLSLKRLRFSDELLEEGMDEGLEDEAARLDAEFILMTGELRALLDCLEEAFLPTEAAAAPAAESDPPF
jgi:recombination associated protein RdgC